MHAGRRGASYGSRTNFELMDFAPVLPDIMPSTRPPPSPSLAVGRTVGDDAPLKPYFFFLIENISKRREGKMMKDGG